MILCVFTGGFYNICVYSEVNNIYEYFFLMRFYL